MAILGLHNQRSGTWLFCVRYPKDYSAYKTSMQRNLLVCGSKEQAEALVEEAQRAVNAFYGLDDIPPGWDQYDPEEWLDEKLQMLSVAAEFEMQRLCQDAGFGWHYQDADYDALRVDIVIQQAVEAVGAHFNSLDPSMWYHGGMYRPEYYTKEVPDACTKDVVPAK